MKNIFITWVLGFLLTGCNQSDKTAIPAQQRDRADFPRQKQQLQRQFFQSIDDVTGENFSSIWVARRDSNFSLALHIDQKDTLWFSYSPECLLVFPYIKDNNKLVVYWDIYVDTKYDFDIVKAVNNIDRKFIGRPFMHLELDNDTTLKATYLIQDLITEINRSGKTRIFFPERFYLVQQGEMYD